MASMGSVHAGAQVKELKVSETAKQNGHSQLVLIPGGEFLMGEGLGEDSSPVHLVCVSSFYMDRHEVTNALYLRFCEDTGHRLPEFWGIDRFRSGPDFPDHPVVGVSYYDATLCAEWLGKRLPTEAEWEYAARGGLAGMQFPNGNTLTPADGNYNRSGHGGPVTVGSYPPNAYGLFDMQGNVVEWVEDVYSAIYYASSPVDNPRGPDTGRFRVIRGGGWHSGASCNRVYYRNALPASWVDFNVGFRCVRDAAVQSETDPSQVAQVGVLHGQGTPSMTHQWLAPSVYRQGTACGDPLPLGEEQASNADGQGPR